MQSNGLRQHVRMIVVPAVVSLSLAIGLWYGIFFRLGLGLLESDESVFTDAIIPTLAMFHAIVAGGVLNKVWEEYKIVRHCVKTKDKDTFMKCRDDRIPLAIHLLLGSLSLIIMALVMMLHYDSAGAGIASTFSVAFVLTLYWEVATNLDNPFKGAWYVNQIPKEWFDDDKAP
jgi:hypothetical protein